MEISYVTSTVAKLILCLKICTRVGINNEVKYSVLVKVQLVQLKFN
jgi:hypothetical protein